MNKTLKIILIVLGILILVTILGNLLSAEEVIGIIMVALFTGFIIYLSIKLKELKKDEKSLVRTSYSKKCPNCGSKNFRLAVVTENELYGFGDWMLRKSGVKRSTNVTKKICTKCGEIYEF
jgi:ribosomal protein L40E